MEGYIKIYRKMLEWEWYDDTNTKVVFLHCLLKANFTERNWRGVIIQRGQFLTSVSNLAVELNLSDMQIRTALNKLQSTHEIAIQTTNKYSIITICNYDSYQVIEDSEQQTKEQPTQQTGNEQVTNKQQTNNNNVIKKKGNKEKKEEDINTTTNVGSTKFHKPTIDEIKEYIEQAGYYWIDADRFYNYYESNGWKVGRNAMKDWRATIRTWAAKDKPTKPETQDPLLPIQEDETPRHILGVDDEYIQRMRKQVEEQRAGWAKS